MKKSLCVILFVSVLCCCFAIGCNSNRTETISQIKVAGMKGPTSIGLVNIMNNNIDNYEFSIYGSADEITPKLIQGDIDLAAIPANLASVIYNKTNGQIKVIAINTLGVVYIVAKGTEINSLNDLRGKTIYATGKGSAPECALRYILSQNGIDTDKDITIEWKNEPTEIVSILKNSENGIAMLPQPYVTIAQNSIEGLQIAIDLNKEWEKLDNNTLFITGVLVTRTKFLESNKDKIDEFLFEYEQSINYVNQNVGDASLLVEKYGIFSANIAEQAIPYCNIKFISGAKMKTVLSGYLTTLFDFNQSSVGGKIPDDGFYYAD